MKEASKKKAEGEQASSTSRQVEKYIGMSQSEDITGLEDNLVSVVKHRQAIDFHRVFGIKWPKLMDIVSVVVDDINLHVVAAHKAVVGGYLDVGIA